jgi:dienelactone hydrolase
MVKMKRGLIMRVILVSFLLIIFFSQLPAQIKTKTKEVPYTHGNVELTGELVYDPLLKSIRSGVLVLPDIWGIDDHVRDKATKLAQLGHVVMIADLYGKTEEATSAEDSLARAEALMENKLMLVERVAQGLSVLREQSKVDQAKIGVVGFGMGATGALELALTAAPVKAFVLFYPQPDFETMLTFKDIKGSLLFLFGSKDEFVPGEDRGQLQNVLDEAHLDWQLIIYSDAVRGFSNPKLGFEVIDGMAYNYNADLRSFDAMRQFFTDLLK